MAADDPNNGAPKPVAANGVLTGEELHRRVQELETELAATHRQLDEMRFERDGFKRLVLDAAAKDYVPPTEEELRSAVPMRPWIDDLIRDLERA